MALKDFADTLNSYGDLVMSRSHQAKIYNILAHNFVESPQLHIDLTLMLEQESHPSVRMQAIRDHLQDFACAIDRFGIDYHWQMGILDLSIKEEQL